MMMTTTMMMKRKKKKKKKKNKCSPNDHNALGISVTSHYAYYRPRLRFLVSLWT